MKKNLKRALSLVLSIVISLGVISAAGIDGGFAEVAAASSTYKNELWMMQDYDYALIRGQKVRIDCSPFPWEGGTAYLPLKATSQYMNATYKLTGNDLLVTLSGGTVVSLTVGSLSWKKGGVAQTDLLLPPMVVDGEVYLSNLATNSVLGTKAFWNGDIGLSVVSTSSISYKRDDYSSLKVQIDTLGALLFDRPKADTIRQDLEKHSGYGTHPRLLVDQDRFDVIRSYYNDPELDPTVYNWVQSYATRGVSIFNSLFTEEYGDVLWKNDEMLKGIRQPYYLYNEVGDRLVGVKQYEYTNPDGTKVLMECTGSGLGDGYDVGGRSNVATHTAKLKQLAFTWQMTGEQKYADAFYLLAKEIGKWEHWGEGHFLNCADGAVEFALGLDWIYHAFDGEPEKRDELAKILYDQGLMKGYYSIKNDTSKLNLSAVAGSGGYKITNRTNNWQTVCGSGMIVSALYLADYEEYRANALYVTETLLGTLEKCLMQYAPDGSYIESPGYWKYGTETYFIMLASLESALGTDYGYFDTVGLQDSCYYVMHITDPSFMSWGFHDGSRGNVSRASFYLAAKAYSDPELAYMRDYMLFERGQSADILDILFYDPSLSEGASGNMGLDRFHKGIDTVTVRKSWDEGSLFAGLHAGANNVAHGDIDSGNFYLEMGGVLWVGDPGTEDYNVGQYFGSLRYRYYRKSLESHNTVLIRSSDLPRGQVYNNQTQSYAKITDYYSDENGAYAIANMKPQYGATCTAAKRGLLLTNSRSTVVVQDEISFSSPTDLTWIAAVKNVFEISEDGRTAFATGYYDDRRVILRVSLLSEDESLRFTTTVSTILSDTITRSNSGNERASEAEKRLIIEKDDCTEFNVSVVFEIMRHEDEIVAYEQVPMAEWQTTDDAWVKEANSSIVYPDQIIPPKYNLSAFAMANRDLAAAKSLAEMGEILRETVIYLTDYDQSNSKVLAAVQTYRGYLDQYNERVRRINGMLDSI